MEQVFVVRRSDLFDGAWPQGFVPLQGKASADLLARIHELGFFAARDEAEQQPAWKQTIPYCVFRRPGQVFCVQRKTAQTESRLHGKLSIGIGGHVNPPAAVGDFTGGDFTGGGSPAAGAGGIATGIGHAAAFFRSALARELAEELHGTEVPEFTPTFLGLLNDDSEGVGRVHSGLVFAADWPADRGLRVREVSKMAGGFRPLAELQPLWQDPARFESWSRMLFEAGIAVDNSPCRELPSRDFRTGCARPWHTHHNDGQRGTYGRTECHPPDA
jgi:predicted NUDIX family phosphoesterase